MIEVKFDLNGRTVELITDPLKRFVDVLRDDFNLSATKEGCGEGECGACSVLVNNQLVNSCLMPIAMVDGASVMTLEGYKNTARFKILESCFQLAGSVQCGFCTPGMILAAEALLVKNPQPSMQDIREGMSGNLCRCTGYHMIIEAVRLASVEGKGLW